MDVNTLKNDSDFKNIENFIYKVKRNNIIMYDVQDHEVRHSSTIINFFKNYELVFKEFLKYLSISTDFEYNDFNFKREEANIDILIKSETQKIVIAIENKINASEHDNQLSRYYQYVTEHYKDYKKYFLFLNITETEPEQEEDKKYWKPISYKTIANIISNCLSNYTDDIYYQLKGYVEYINWYLLKEYPSNVIDSLKNLINNYPKEIEYLCNKTIPIESQEIEQEAVDFIKEYKTKIDRQKMEYIIDKLAENTNNIVDKNYSSATIIRFQMKNLLKQFPNILTNNSAWHNNTICTYEIDLRHNNMNLKLEISGDGISDELKNKIKNLFPDLNDNWKFKNIFKNIFKNKTFKSYKLTGKTVDEIKDEINNRIISINNFITDNECIFLESIK